MLKDKFTFREMRTRISSRFYSEVTLKVSARVLNGNSEPEFYHERKLPF
jgi:hypothetical protein